MNSSPVFIKKDFSTGEFRASPNPHDIEVEGNENLDNGNINIEFKVKRAKKFIPISIELDNHDVEIINNGGAVQKNVELSPISRNAPLRKN